MSLQTTFENVAKLVKTVKRRPSDEELLTLYGLYKQATEGNNKTDKPWVFELEKSSKWNAWSKNEQMSKEDAQKSYIDKAYEVINKYMN